MQIMGSAMKFSCSVLIPFILLFTMNAKAQDNYIKKDIVIPGNVMWTSTGITLDGQKPVFIIASGTITFAVGRSAGPEGVNVHVNNGDLLLPGAPPASLICKIGNSGSYFAVGKFLNGYVRPDLPGVLQCGINESRTGDVYSDNSGAFLVTVLYPKIK
jgi:hypothetical protein